MNFDGIDLNEASLEEVREMEIGHVAIQLCSLGMNKRLCSMEGREVIAEYEYKGDFVDVVTELNMYSLTLEKTELDESFRADIIERKNRLINHRENADSDDKDRHKSLDAIMEAIQTRNPENVIAASMINHEQNQDADLRHDALHNAQMCECYTN